MPFCEVGKHLTTDISGGGIPADEVDSNGIKIFYRTYGKGPTKVLLIIGLAGTHDSWIPQIRGLTGTDMPNDDAKMPVDRNSDAGEVDEDDSGSGAGIQICAFDNRGMGRSSVPTKKTQYTTKIMANDAIAVMNHLGWRKAHVFGHSMGGMIACKLAAMVPERVSSLALLNVTGGGFECFPKPSYEAEGTMMGNKASEGKCTRWEKHEKEGTEYSPKFQLDRQTLSVAIRFLQAKTPEQRAAVDLDTHYSQEYLEEYVGSSTRRSILYKEYVKGISSTGMQSTSGFDGQINACWTHKMTRKEIETIRTSGFLVSVIHGRHDIIAQIYYARRLAEKLQPAARMVELHGGHLVSHERTEEVNQALWDLIRASETRISPHDWTNLSKKTSGWLERGMSLGRTTLEARNSVLSAFGKLSLCLSYLIGLLVLLFEHLQRASRNLRPARVASSLT